MAEALFGTLEQFQPGLSASFTRYVERVKIYWRANGVDDADRHRDRDIFLTVMGPACYDRLVDLLQPRSPAEVSFDDLVNVLTSYYVIAIRSRLSGCSDITFTTGCKPQKNLLQHTLLNCGDWPNIVNLAHSWRRCCVIA